MNKEFTWIAPQSFTPAKLIPTTFGHYYSNPDGVRYPSVTTMFSKLEPFEKSPAYAGWIDSLGGGIEGKAIAKHISNVAMGNGTDVHSVIEHYLNNKNTDIKLFLLVKAHFENLKPLLYNINNISATEIPLYSDSMRLSGTADCIAEYNGVLSVIDFKTSNKKKQEDTDQAQNYFLQTTAYSIMWEELTGQDIPQIVILVSSNDGNLQAFVKKPTDYAGLLKEKLEKFEVMRN